MIESPIEARRQGVHPLAQTKFEIVDIDPIWQSAYGFPQSVVIVVQERQTLCQTEQRRLVG